MSDVAVSVNKKCIFLAAMSSSRSDVVTQFVRSCVRSSVRPLFFLLVSLKFYLVLRMFKVSRVFQGSFKDVSSKLRVLTKSFKEV